MPTPIDVKAVQTLMAQTVNKVAMDIGNALVSGLKEKIDFKTLAQKNTQGDLTEDLEELDPQSKMVYQKLFVVSLEFIQKKAPHLLQVFALIDTQTGSKEASGKFLGSFVLKEVKPLLETLEKVQPDSLKDKKLWE